MTQHWVVIVKKQVAKQLNRLPKEIVEILSQFIHDLESDGPTPKGWLTKHVLGRNGIYVTRLKREYRVFYEVADPNIILISVVHRKEAY